MKRKRNAGQVILISSDSEPEDQPATDSDKEENGRSSDCDEDEDEDDDDDDDADVDIEDDYDDDDDASDDEADVDDDDTYDGETDEENDDTDEEDNDDDTEDVSDSDDFKAEDIDADDGRRLRSMSGQVPARNFRRRDSCGFHGARHAESHKEAKKKSKYKQTLKKVCKNVHTSTALSSEDSKLLSEALNMIRKGDLEELKSEHCKAYLRHHSLRLAGSKTTLLDRVREHVELTVCDGMAKYPKSTFTINCTGDACTGDVVLFRQKVKNHKNANKHSMQLSWVTRVVAGRIVKESYGSDKQQHTFTVEVLWSRGRRALPLLYPLLVKGRNLYRMKTYRQPWANEDERKRVLEEKHSRGDMARSAREDRVLGKKEIRASRMHVSKGKALVRSKRQRTSGRPSSIVRRRASSYAQEQETRSEAAVSTRVISAHRDLKQRFSETRRTVMSTLRIKACFAGILIGPQGRNIGSIERASGARLRVCNDPLRPDSRLVEISGLPAEVQAATGMVTRYFLDRGLPPAVVATQLSGSTVQGLQQAEAAGYGAFVSNYGAFIPHGAVRQPFR